MSFFLNETEQFSTLHILMNLDGVRGAWTARCNAETVGTDSADFFGRNTGTIKFWDQFYHNQPWNCFGILSHNQFWYSKADWLGIAESAPQS